MGLSPFQKTWMGGMGESRVFAEARRLCLAPERILCASREETPWPKRTVRHRLLLAGRCR
jgi:hypothetical protein